jgi:hypothetical protein
VKAAAAAGHEALLSLHLRFNIVNSRGALRLCVKNPAFANQTWSQKIKNLLAHLLKVI